MFIYKLMSIEHFSGVAEKTIFLIMNSNVIVSSFIVIYLLCSGTYCGKYFGSGQALTYLEAKKYCERWSSHLVDFDSLQQQRISVKQNYWLGVVIKADPSSGSRVFTYVRGDGTDLKYQRWSHGEPHCQAASCAVQVTPDNKWISVDYSDGRKAIAVCQVNAMLKLKNTLSSRIDEEVTQLQELLQDDPDIMDISGLNATLREYLNSQIANTDLRIDEADYNQRNQSMSDRISQTVLPFREVATRVHRLLVTVKKMLNASETAFNQSLETKLSIINDAVHKSQLPRDTDINYLHICLIVLVFFILQVAFFLTYLNLTRRESANLSMALLRDFDL
ncbi:hypothetical protein HDE_12879 [Halotydeus destructor]|nr:hypothetical protein HDE_12879 [Halotydeus destructor]